MRRRFGFLAAVALVCGLFTADASQAQQVYIHGYITQGYGSASDYPIYGIGTDGTGDYRSAAFQTRFLATSKDHLVVQFSHQRLGSSLMMEFEDDVAVDWLFYQRRIFGGSVKAGRFPMPRGLFNEVRDVGVLLPFFRASKAFYSEGVESVDGVSFARSFGIGDWVADATAFYGDFDVKVEILDETGLVAIQQELEKTVGGQMIVNTPIPGVRVGGSYLSADYKNTGEPFTLWTTSADASFERLFVRGEYEHAYTEGYDYVAYYGQAGVNIYGGLWLNGQAEWNTNTFGIPGFGDLEVPAIQDYAAGLSYRFSPKLVLKSEYHAFEGYQVGVPVSYFGPAVTNNYFVLGVSAAF